MSVHAKDSDRREVATQVHSSTPSACAPTKFHHEGPFVDKPSTNTIKPDEVPFVTVLMPCLNEARTLASCIEQAHVGCQNALALRIAKACSKNLKGDVLAHIPSYEILIADNGSTDDSPQIAERNGACVIHVSTRGYGAALRNGIEAARAEYVFIGDCDCSYDFRELPKFLDSLEAGNHLVMGNRFAGRIMPGAMPWHHRYIGNPILSGIGRALYRTLIRDWHCGMRAFERRKISDLGLQANGMEFASEMVIRAAQERLAVAEIPITLWPDERDGSPHLRSIRDGIRHLSLMVRMKFGL